MSADVVLNRYRMIGTWPLQMKVVLLLYGLSRTCAASGMKKLPTPNMASTKFRDPPALFGNIHLQRSREAARGEMAVLKRALDQVGYRTWMTEPRAPRSMSSHPREVKTAEFVKLYEKQMQK